MIRSLKPRILRSHTCIAFCTLLIIFNPHSGTAQEKKSWPDQLINKSTPEVTSPTQDAPPYIYQTKTFRFVCDKKIAIDKMRAFAMTAESVPAAISRIPLPLLSLPTHPDGEKQTIYVFTNEEDFIRAGGKPNSAGYYSGRHQSVYLRAEFFIDVPVGRLPNYNLLVHELAHLSTHGILGLVPSWLSEGTAEYMSAAFIPKGSYRFDDMVRSIPAHAKRHINTKETVELPSIEHLISLSNREWGEYVASLGKDESAYPHYLAALILTHYVFHLDPEGRAKAEQYIDMLKARKPLKEANALLFPAETLKTLPGNLENYWRERGLKIRFQK